MNFFSFSFPPRNLMTQVIFPLCGIDWKWVKKGQTLAHTGGGGDKKRDAMMIMMMKVGWSQKFGEYPFWCRVFRWDDDMRSQQAHGEGWKEEMRETKERERLKPVLEQAIGLSSPGSACQASQSEGVGERPGLRRRAPTSNRFAIEKKRRLKELMVGQLRNWVRSPSGSHLFLVF